MDLTSQGERNSEKRLEAQQRNIELILELVSEI